MCVGHTHRGQGVQPRRTGYPGATDRTWCVFASDSGTKVGVVSDGELDGDDDAPVMVEAVYDARDGFADGSHAQGLGDVGGNSVKCRRAILECLEFDSLPCDGRAASKSRYEFRRCWAKYMGIKVIRVDVPQCVEDLLRDEFGARTSQFVACKNKCSCDLCVSVEQEAEAEAFDNDAAYDATTSGDGGGDGDAGEAD